MPMPMDGESQDKFMERCIPMVMGDGSAADNDQAVAMCMNMYKEGGKTAAKTGARHSGKDRELINRSHRSAQQIAVDMVELGAELEEAIEEAADSKAISLDKLRDQVYRAWSGLYGSAAGMLVDTWLPEIFDEYVIAFIGQKYYQVAYTNENGTITFATRDQWQEVQEDRQWVAKRLSLENKTNHLKTIGKTDDELRVANYIVLYGGRDLHGENFSPDVDLESSYTKTGRLYVDWEHGEDEDPDSPGEDDVLGYVDWATAKKDKRGTWVERVLDRRNRYMQYIEPLIDENLIGTSSEAVRSGMKRREDTIIRWPLKRDTLTVQPAEPRNLSDNALTALKSLAELKPAFKAYLPEAARKTAEASEQGKTAAKTTTIEVHDMAEQTQTQEAAVKRSEFDGLSEKVNRILEIMENSPAAKKAGLIAPDSETDHPESKSLADFFVAVKHKNVKRLHEVYGSFSADEDGPHQKDIIGTAGVSGAYLLPKDHRTDIMNLVTANSPIIAALDPIPVQARSGDWPSLDVTVTPTAGSGQTAMAGGFTLTPRAEGGAATETQPLFEDLEWELHSESAYVEVSKEMSADSPTAIEGLLRRVAANAYQAKMERHILRGSGAGQPLGILNAAVTVAITTATNGVFAWADALAMFSRFKNYGKPMWIIHPLVWADIGIFEVGTGGAVYVSNLQQSLPQTLLGFPIVASEHMPAANNDDVILASMAAYLLFEKGGFSVSFSEHAAFTSLKDTWLFDWRCDGLPGLKSAITLADPQGGTTISPFLYHDD